MYLEKTIAHIDQNNREKKQLLITHLINTGISCYELGDKIDMANMTYITGLLHDCGKFSDSFQEKILNNSNKFVDHSTLGGVIIFKMFADIFTSKSNHDFSVYYKIRNVNYNKFSDYSHILTYAILSHHGQYDFIKKDADEYYDFKTFKRLKKYIDVHSKELQSLYDDILSLFNKYKINLIEIYKLGFIEYLKLCDKLSDLSIKSSENSTSEAESFYKSLFIRLIVSILKSADIEDTINSYETIVSDEISNNLDIKLNEFEDKINSKYKSFPINSEINKIRNLIAEKILSRSINDETGIYKLDLPTGAGKTLLSLRYGINQMKYQKKERFFYVTSYLSVLEQNARQMKEILNSDSYVLEHHSNVIREEDYYKGDDEDDSLFAIRREFLLNDWTSPIILTSMVQFFNSIFKGKSSNITRFKSFINSVVIMDELQSLPIDVIYMVNLALNFLNKIMKVTIVLSTATQPLYNDDMLEHKLIYGNSKNELSDIIKLNSEELNIFKRVECKLINSGELSTLDDISNLLYKNLNKSALVILNTKAAVKKMYEKLSDLVDEDDLYYLTTNLYADDRLTKIDEIKTRLKRNEKILVVSTSLVEAGVDFDFEIVIRSFAGLDSVVQAMGRCNREGKLDKGLFYLINLDINDEYIKSTYRKKQKESMEYLMRKAKNIRNIVELNNDYFSKLYANIDQDMLRFKSKDGNLFDLFSLNKNDVDILFKQDFHNLSYKLISAKGYKNIIFSFLDNSINLFPKFETVYKNFNLINDTANSAVVECDKTRNILNEIRNMEVEYYKNYDVNIMRNLKNLIGKLNRYTVPIRKEDINKCQVIFNGFLYILSENFYDNKIGLKLDNPDLFIL